MDQDMIRSVSQKLAHLQTRGADISDIDGTVYKWQLLIDLVLAISHSFPQKSETVMPLQTAIDQYRKRITPFSEVIRLLLIAIPEVFIGIPKTRVENLARVIAEREATQTYVFPRNLFSALIKRPPALRRLLIAITGAPQEVAEPFCEKLGFDAVIGANYHTDANGIYTGTRDIDSGVNKGKVMDDLAAACGLVWDGCIGLGDSEADIPIFERVSYPVAVNPNTVLIDHIRRHPDKRIVYVRDGQKSGVQFFCTTDTGRFMEITPLDALPNDLGCDLLSSLPGTASSIVPF